MMYKVLGFCAVFVILHATYGIVFLDDKYLLTWCREDGPVENIGAAFFALAGVMFLWSYAKSYRSASEQAFLLRHRNVFYLALGLLFLLCFFEEISWGQRVFGIETPEKLKEINAQGELNLHNIWLFQTGNKRPDGTEKSALAITLNMNRLFSLFWLVFCVMIPVVYHVSSLARRGLGYLRMPIVPLWIGALFLVHAVVFHQVYNAPTDIHHRIYTLLNELKETNYAFLFFTLACYTCWLVWTRSDPGRPAAAVGQAGDDDASSAKASMAPVTADEPDDVQTP